MPVLVGDPSRSNEGERERERESGNTGWSSAETAAAAASVSSEGGVVVVVAAVGIVLIHDGQRSIRVVAVQIEKSRHFEAGVGESE